MQDEVGMRPFELVIVSLPTQASVFEASAGLQLTEPLKFSHRGCSTVAPAVKGKYTKPYLETSTIPS